MDFALTDQQEAIRDAIAKICEDFPDAYWLKKDHDGGFPHDFHKALADAGWLGICVPEAYGGSGLGITEAAIMMRTIAESGAGMSGASAVHINVFGLNPVVVFGTEEQRKRMLPPMVEGREKACFAVTEPNTGLNTTQLKTRAVAKNDRLTSSTARRSGSRPPRSRTRSCCSRAPRRWRRCARRRMG
ncbi:alkylation response protein AidB-like acyl-CoA dehydrogenase [Bradyrhizobium sp. i1.4.4]